MKNSVRFFIVLFVSILASTIVYFKTSNSTVRVLTQIKPVLSITHEINQANVADEIRISEDNMTLGAESEIIRPESHFGKVLFKGVERSPIRRRIIHRKRIPLKKSMSKSENNTVEDSEDSLLKQNETSDVGKELSAVKPNRIRKKIIHHKKRQYKGDELEHSHVRVVFKNRPDEVKMAYVKKDLEILKTFKNFDLKGYLQTSRYLLRPEVCENRLLTLVICVAIRRDNGSGRKMIRETWGSPGRRRNSPVALVFFVGVAKEDEAPFVHEQILKENIRYQDIIQTNFLDDYHNLTLKTLSMVTWAAEYCNQTEFILKADDDVYVNVPLLVHELRNIGGSNWGKPFIIGNVVHQALPVRWRGHKWTVNRYEYKDNLFPDYANGGGTYAMTMSAAVKIRDIAPSVPYLKLEDVFITGICAKAAGIALQNDYRFSNFNKGNAGRYYVKNISGSHYLEWEIRKIDQFLRYAVSQKFWLKEMEDRFKAQRLY